MSEQTVQDAFTGVWPAVPDSVAALRQAVGTHARALGAGNGVLATIRLAASEAATNAVLHAYRGAEEPGDVHVRVARQGGELVIAVWDDGAGMRPRPDSPGLGLGLPLIAQVAASVEVESRPSGGTLVSMRFAL